MKCLRIPRRYLIYSFGFFVSLFFTFCFFSSSSFAVSDATFIISGSSSVSLCSGGSYSGSSYCGYTYMIIESTDVPFSIRCTIDSNSYNFGTYSKYAVFSSPVFLDNYSGISCSGQFAYTRATITLSDSFSSGIIPDGSISITENGTYDVSSYAEAVVDVSETVVQGDYHDDLVNINQSIIICAGVCLVIYFFYAIYRMIIRGSHGN